MEKVTIEQIADGGFLVVITDKEYNHTQYYFSTLAKLTKAIREYYTPDEVTQ